MTATQDVLRFAPLSGDKWLAEARELIQTQKRPDGGAAFAAMLNRRIGGEHALDESVRYLTSALYGMTRYAAALVGDSVPVARNATAPPKKTRREVIRNRDGRIVAVEDVG